MTNITHTPGPWIVGPYTGSGGTDWRQMLAPGEFGNGYLGEALEKNARLMVAAPELVEALRDLLGRMSNSSGKSYAEYLADIAACKNARELLARIEAAA